MLPWQVKIQATGPAGSVEILCVALDIKHSHLKAIFVSFYSTVMFNLLANILYKLKKNLTQPQE